MPMSDLAHTEGVYPSESAYTIYAYEDAAYLYQILSETGEAADLLNNYVTPMRTAYNETFWHADSDFYLPRRDTRSTTGSGNYFYDFWAQTMLPPLHGDIGDDQLSTLRDEFVEPRFYDTDYNYRWLSTDSDNYAPDNQFYPGYVMEGGFFNGVPNMVPAVASYQLEQNALADDYANDFYLDIWLRMGPYETMRQWDTTPDGMYLETSIYIEPLTGTWWLFKEAMGLQVDGTTVTVSPRMDGIFTARNVRITAAGLSAVFNYTRDASGEEYIHVTHNEGLIINAPNATPTAVNLATFEATMRNGTAFVTWETMVELDNLGFNLYRSNTVAGPWTRLNTTLIPTKNPGGISGAYYEWRDGNVPSGASVYYRLEDVNIYGASTFHGPTSVTNQSQILYRIYIPVILRY